MASPDNPNFVKLENSEPRFLSVLISPGKYEKHIGMEAGGLDGKYKKFLYACNIKFGVHDSKLIFIAGFKVMTGLDLVFDKPLLPLTSQPHSISQRPIRDMKEPGWLGAYVNTDDIDVLKNVITSLGNMPPHNYWWREDPEDPDRTKIKSFLEILGKL